MNLFEVQEQLKDFSKDQLVSEMKMPSGTAPPYLVLSELQRRTRMEKAMAADGQGQPQTTVLDDAVAAAGVPQGGLGDMARALAPKTDMDQNDAAAAQQMPQGAPQQMAQPPVEGMAQGGEIDFEPINVQAPQFTPAAGGLGSAAQQLGITAQGLSDAAAQYGVLGAGNGQFDTSEVMHNLGGRNRNRNRNRNKKEDVDPFANPWEYRSWEQPADVPFFERKDFNRPFVQRRAEGGLMGMAEGGSVGDLYQAAQNTPWTLSDDDWRKLYGAAGPIMKNKAMTERGGQQPEGPNTQALRGIGFLNQARPDAPPALSANVDPIVGGRDYSPPYVEQPPDASPGQEFPAPAQEPSMLAPWVNEELSGAAPKVDLSASPLLPSAPEVEASRLPPVKEGRMAGEEGHLAPWIMDQLAQEGSGATPVPQPPREDVVPPSAGEMDWGQIGETLAPLAESFDRTMAPISQSLNPIRRMLGYDEMADTVDERAAELSAGDPGMTEGEPLGLPEDGEPNLIPAPVAPTGADGQGSPGGSGGPGGGGGSVSASSTAAVSGSGGEKSDAEKMLEQDKWLALAQFGMALMSSRAPTFGQAFGEAGQSALGQLGEARQTYLDRKEKEEIMALKRATLAARSSGRGGSGGGSGYELGLSTDEARLLGSLEDDLNRIDAQLAMIGYVPGSDEVPPVAAPLVAQRRGIIEDMRTIRDAATGGVMSALEAGRGTGEVNPDVRSYNLTE